MKVTETIRLLLYLLSKNTSLYKKTACYAQVEARASIKKESENLHPYPLEVERLVEKGWCNESAATIQLKCNDNFIREVPKKTGRLCS